MSLTTWAAGIAWRALLKRLLPYALAAVVIAWAGSVWWAYGEGKERGRASLEASWADAYTQAVRRWHITNQALSTLNQWTARELEAARLNKKVAVREAIKYAEEQRDRPELAPCVFTDEFMQLRRTQLARTRGAGPD